MLHNAAHTSLAQRGDCVLVSDTLLGLGATLCISSRTTPPRELRASGSQYLEDCWMVFQEVKNSKGQALSVQLLKGMGPGLLSLPV